MNVNLGSGPDYRPGWLNVEIDTAHRADLHADVRDHAAITAACVGPVELIYMKHVLEHLAIAEVAPQLRWCATLLAPGGQLIIDGPDLRSMCRHLASKREWDWSDVEMIYGGQGTVWDFHKAGWGPEFLSRLLTEVGLVDIRVQLVDLCFVIAGTKPLEAA